MALSVIVWVNPLTPLAMTATNLPAWSEKLAPRLKSQIEFLVAIDALKSVYRASHIASNERRENSAEHSWHLTMFARILAEHANEAVDIERVIFMLMVHDIVEVDAGDTPLHGQQNPEQEANEQAAATRLFGLLPDDQSLLLRQCWDEFEAAQSADARFAKALDRLQPVLLNALTEGGTWKDYEVSLDQVTSRTAQIGKGSDTLWDMANAIFNEAVDHGWLKTARPADLS
ncbi:HD domain-containing protein [Granulosicoccus antarcticus]|uniref:5'-deoxynucleotidase YfbR n=1 Tax=Granulosicoccus antarcticus IMCC3135 TaxID=1192854 RepID=A0A2Z2NP66_9GAMM|nr:HD domain-containing protein [Granulosicoccus antarcticus]ASJ71721.1 5'-deoxynucleotidase YfbR [Granulosicoccus antarcticus IMCC3135]